VVAGAELGIQIDRGVGEPEDFFLVLGVDVVGEVAVVDQDDQADAVERDPVREEAPLTMLIPTTILAVAVVLLGVFNGEIVSRFIDTVIPASFAR